MGEVFFCATNDGSAGLFNKNVDDIYHSTHGAYSESYEKFLLSSGFLDFIKNNDKVSILDICYGIGYNSKTALDEILKLDKTLEVKIDALEYDEKLIKISPFIKNQLINNNINKFLINNIDLYQNYTVKDIIKSFIELKGMKYINWANIWRFMLGKFLSRYKYTPLIKTPAFLHNIYFRYMSTRNSLICCMPFLYNFDMIFMFLIITILCNFCQALFFYFFKNDITYYKTHKEGF